MIRLMKYEFRKTRLSKILVLIFILLLELSYLLGVFLEDARLLGTGVAGLFTVAMFSVMYFGIESILFLYRDLSTKQSYMLFLTPKSSFQILGAKILENMLIVFISGLLFSALAAIDVTVAILNIGGLEELMKFIRQFADYLKVNITLSGPEIFVYFMAVLAAWLAMVVRGDLAVVLSETVLSGRKMSGFISFLIFVALSYVSGVIYDLLPQQENIMAQSLGMILVSFAMGAVMYAAAGWIMEKKLSV